MNITALMNHMDNAAATSNPERLQRTGLRLSAAAARACSAQAFTARSNAATACFMRAAAVRARLSGRIQEAQTLEEWSAFHAQACK